MSYKTLEERIFESSVPEPNSGCWIWMKTLSNAGYGAMTVSKGVTKSAHRMSYSVFKGPITNGLLVLHKCDIPCCVNPDHLFLGTHSDNTQDMIKKGRQRKFSGIRYYDLSDQDIIKILEYD
jgi:hypothetical protein